METKEFDKRVAKYMAGWEPEYRTYDPYRCAPNKLRGARDETYWLGLRTRRVWVEEFTVPESVLPALSIPYEKYRDLKARNSSEAGTILIQLETGLEELYNMARNFEGKGLFTEDMKLLGAQLAALADLALERERAMKSINTDSLMRSAAALESDLDAARNMLGASGLEWKVELATRAQTEAQGGTF